LHPSYLGLRSAWGTKEYMSPTEIDKTAGKRYGYIPDYSIWVNSIPLAIVEAKAPDVAIQVALREARLYAGEIK
jgi:type I site-specific restriction endonuclease